MVTTYVIHQVLFLKTHPGSFVELQSSEEESCDA